MSWCLPVQVALGGGLITVGCVNDLDARLQANIGHDTESSTSLGGARLGHRLACRHTVSTLLVLSRNNDTVAMAGIACLSDDGSVLVEDVAPVRLNTFKLSRDILVENSNNGSLGDVLNHVALRIRVGDIGILVVVVPPVVVIGNRWHVVSAAEVKGVSSLVNHGSHHSFDGSNESNGSVSLESPTTIGRYVNDMANPLAHLDGHLAKLAGHGIDGSVGTFVVTEDPRIATLGLLANYTR